ncbi:MAG: TRAP transporter large permease subunit, partial [Deltaproteobacteria bacterium]|nr:TRAP transporter large permease subunit [Deltaproteobacteria bacterium]
LLIAAATTTFVRNHICLRNPQSRLDYLFADGSMVLGNAFLTASSIAQVLVDRRSGITIQHVELPVIWTAGFALLTLLSLRNLLRRPPTAKPGGTLLHASLCAPPFAGMAIATGIYFLLKEGHPSGLAIYMQKLAEHALLYLQVGLYVWVGMILARTRLAAMAFDVLRPWRLPPEVLAALVVAFAAFPTAYSGASGIFVMAAGPLLFMEMRRAGARPQLAIATTAMSGSLGVSISPCLLVVIIAAMNKELTTDQLYGWGWRVYALAAAGILLAALIVRFRQLKDIAPPKEAAPVSGRNLAALLPFVIIGALVVCFYTFGLGTKVNEHTAPTVLPVLLILFLWWDTRSQRRTLPEDAPADVPRPRTGRLLVEATAETSGHIGALLMLMGCSMCFGGIIERSEVMSLVGNDLGSPIVAMAICVVLKVIIGMLMDPYGAVILVSVTLAPVAYRSGIDPVHFWAMVLVSFELGYLTPPIGLNTLLSRRIVEMTEPELLLPQPGKSWLARHEGVLLNCTIMTVVLLCVAFLPFLWK